MKRIILTTIISSTFALSSNLPFIGKAWFNFAGGSGTNEFVVIKKNGHTIIGVCGLSSCGEVYNGKYKKIFKLYPDSDRAYSFSNNKVMMMSSRTGKVIRKCNDYGSNYDDGTYGDKKPCIQELNKDKNFHVPQGDKAVEQDIKKFQLKAYAHKLITGKNPNEYTINDIIVKTNSSGLRIFCHSIIKICKTEQEIINFAN